MITSLALALLTIASGTLVTYIYDRGAALAVRFCTGTCIGLASLGLVGFVFASFLGLTSGSILLSVLLLLVPALLLRDPDYRERVLADLRSTTVKIRRAIIMPTWSVMAYTLFYLLLFVMFWQAFSRAVIETPEGIYTGALNNFGDLPFHMSVITGFVYGNNFPPEDPTYAGVRFTYPFVSDFVAAIFMRCGADLRQAMFLENFLLAVSLVVLLHRWALELVKDRLAAVITPLLVIFNGGLGWVLLWQQAQQNPQGLWGVLMNLPPSFTVIPNTTWRWGNAISSLLIPQRGILLGIPLVIVVLTQLWIVWEDSDSADVKRRMVAAGCVAGLLPLVHAHSFVVVMSMSACLALINRHWRDWSYFFLAALLLALPQLWWSTHNSAVIAKTFFEWHLGWDRGSDSVFWFWFRNTGLFIPALVVALLWKSDQYLVRRKLVLFYLPFSLCFIVPNGLKLAPWVWDNIKVLFYWWIASAPIVALLLAHLWRYGRTSRLVSLALFLSITLAGALDVAGIVMKSTKYQIFDRPAIQFSEMVKQQTEPNARIVHAPVHNHPIFLTGRRSLMGYPGHIWTHGLEYTQREAEIRSIYAGMPEAKELLQKYKIQYAVVGPLERSVMKVNPQFFQQFSQTGEVGEYRLYKITQP